LEYLDENRVILYNLHSFSLPLASPRPKISYTAHPNHKYPFLLPKNDLKQIKILQNTTKRVTIVRKAGK